MKQEEMTTQRMIGSTLLEYTYSLACLLWYHSNNANILNYNNRNITFYKRLLVKNVFFSAEEINAQELMNQLNAFIRLFFLLFFFKSNLLTIYENEMWHILEICWLGLEAIDIHTNRKKMLVILYCEYNTILRSIDLS